MRNSRSKSVALSAFCGGGDDNLFSNLSLINECTHRPAPSPSCSTNFLLYMIVYGWNDFKIVSYTPEALGFTNDSPIRYTAEVRQRYFHVFFIPFFGIGKMWVINEGGNFHEMPEVYRTAIRQRNPKPRSPWYTFSGLALVALIISISVGVHEYNLNKRRQAKVDQLAAKLALVAEPQPLDRYVLIDEGYTSFAAQVDSVTQQAVLLRLPDPAYNQDNTYRMAMPHYFDDTGYVCKQVWVLKSLLKQGCVEEPEQISTFKGTSMLPLYFLSDKRLRIEEVERKGTTTD